MREQKSEHSGAAPQGLCRVSNIRHRAFLGNAITWRGKSFLSDLRQVTSVPSILYYLFS